MTSTARLLAGFFACAAFSIAGSAAAMAGNDAAGLTEEQSAFAARTLAFIDKIDGLHFATVQALNGNDNRLEERTFDNEYGNWSAKVARGPTVEKAGRTLTITKKPSAPFQRPSSWSRFYALDTHAKTPLIGILHAAFVVQFYPDGSSTVGGWLDVMPGAMRQDDIAVLKKAMDEVYDKYGVDAAIHRELVCKGTEEEENRYRRDPACVGGSFYGRDMMSVTEENFQFMTEAYEIFVMTYLDLLELRKDTEFTEDDGRAQDAMRLNWFEDRLYADPYTTAVTPYEAWSLYSLPPVVKF